MFSVFPYTSADELLEELVSHLSEKRENNPLTPLKVVVPSVHFRDWLQIKLARKFGICMGFEFSMPQDFVTEVFAAAGIKKAGEWSKRRLEWSVFEHGRNFPGVGAAASVRDRFAMARLVADRLDQYGHFRPEMFEAWSQGRGFLQKPEHRAEEAWQRDLWNNLFEKFGKDPGLIPQRLNNTVAAAKLSEAFRAVTVIGSGSLDPLLVETLHVLSASGAGVDIRVILPCLGYLADIRKQNQSGNLALPDSSSDPEDFELGAAVQNNPLLVSMARHAVGAFVLIGENGHQYENWPDPGDLVDQSTPNTLLKHIQQAVRANSEYTKVGGLNADESLRIHECYGARRELEVLRDELLRAFSEIEDLKPEDVLIAVPSLDDYAPLVPAVFHTKENPLPVRLTELPASEGDEVLEGLLALLELARGGRGRASEVLDLMQLRAVREALGVGEDEAKLEFLADKFRDSGITQGFAIGDEQPGDWEFSINRLVAGEFFGPQEPEQSPEGGFQLPVADSMGSNFSELETFLQWLADLRSTLLDWQTAASPGEWTERLKKAAAALLAGEDGRMSEADKILRFLSGLAVTTPVDVAVILDWMESETDEANRRASISGATPFGRLKQLHNTPCRVLALVGMQNDNFPSRTKSPSWDLLRAQPKIWDRNARVDERQMVLDAVLAPTERLIITASTQNIRTNKKQPFSTCVDELLAAAQKLGVERKTLVLEHPLQPFSAKYFEPGSNLPKPFGEKVREIAIAANNNCKAPLPFHKAPFKDKEMPSVEITVAQLAAFWRSPARGYLKAQKIDLPLEEDDDTTLDFSPVNLDSLQKWKLKNAILKEQLSGIPNESRSKALAAADRGLPPGFLAEIEWQVFQKMEAIANEIKKAKPTDRILELEISGCRISCPVQLSNDIVFVGDCGKMKEARHFLPYWLTALVAAASGLMGGLAIFYEGDPVSELRSPVIDPEDAKKILKAVLDGYLQGQHRPLRFALEVSPVLAMDSKKKPAEKLDEVIKTAFHKARTVWVNKGFGDSAVLGEGQSPAAMLAWRDADPFEDEEEWMEWALAISEPLATWKKNSKKK
jgi:exodeoxyribonuclease V gamma subunit